MAHALQYFRSQTTINVSHEARTSPLPESKEEDDIYGLSPETAARSEAFRSSAREREPIVHVPNSPSQKELAPTATGIDDFGFVKDSVGERPIIKRPPTTHRTLSNPESLAQPAIVEEGLPRQEHTTPAGAHTDHADSAKVRISGSTTSKRPSATSQTSMEPTPKRATVPTASKGKLSSATSSLAALQARRAVQSNGQIQPAKQTDDLTERQALNSAKTQAQGVHSTDDKATGVTIGLSKKDNVNPQPDTSTSARGATPASKAATADRPGKLPSVRGGMRRNIQNNLSKEPSKAAKAYASKKATASRKTRAANDIPDDDVQSPQSNKRASTTVSRPSQRSKPAAPEPSDDQKSSSASEYRNPLAKAKLVKKSQASQSAGTQSEIAANSGPSRTTRAKAAAQKKEKAETNQTEAANLSMSSPPPLSRKNKGKQQSTQILPHEIRNEDDENQAAATEVSKGHTKSGNASQEYDKFTGTQQDPVEIGDEPESSSVLSDVPDDISAPLNTVMDNVIPNRRDLFTPAPMPSSPPAAGMVTSFAPKSIRGRKPEIIGFSASGPLNQGSLRSDTPGVISGRNDRSSIFPDKTGLLQAPPKRNRKRATSSIASSTRTRREVPRPSNVADDFSDALNMLTGNQKPPGPAFKMSSDPIEQAPSSPQTTKVDEEKDNRMAGHYSPAEEFAHIDDLEGDTLVQDAPPEPVVEPATAKVRTASQKAMPAPRDLPKHLVQASSAVATEQLRTTLPSIEIKQTLNSTRTRKSPTPEPSTERAVKTAKPSEADAAVSAKNHVPVGAAPGVSQSQKRAGPSEVPGEHPQKRLKVEDSHARSTGVIEPMPASLKQSFTVGRKEAKSKSTQPDYRKMSRQPPQGSQTVDKQGSPIPPDMDVDESNTVLEAYAKQAPFTSDLGTAKRVQAVMQTLGSRSDDEEDDDNVEEEVFSSNIKPKPASPQAGSQRMSTIKLSNLDSKRFLQNGDALLKMSDPFTSSGQSSQSGTQESGSSPLSTFAKSMHLQTERLRISTKQHRNGQFMDVPRPVTMSDKVPREILANKVRRVDEPLSKSTQALDQEIDKFRTLTCPAHFLRDDPIQGAEAEPESMEEEDPEKTLVEDDQSSYYEEQSNDSASSKSSLQALHELEPEYSEPLSDDLMSWRKQLKPHQLNLFDQLTRTAQRVVELFAEQEDRVERRLEEYYRENLRIVEQKELLRAKEYDQLVAELQRARRAKRKELKRAAVDIASLIDNYAAKKEERSAQNEEWEAANREVDKFIATLT